MWTLDSELYARRPAHSFLIIFFCLMSLMALPPLSIYCCALIQYIMYYAHYTTQTRGLFFLISFFMAWKKKKRKEMFRITKKNIWEKYIYPIHIRNTGKAKAPRRRMFHIKWTSGGAVDHCHWNRMPSNILYVCGVSVCVVLRLTI